MDAWLSLPLSKLVPLAKAGIKYLQEERDADRNVLLDSVIGKKLGCFSSKKITTREEAIKYFEENDDFGVTYEYTAINVKYENQEKFYKSIVDSRKTLSDTEEVQISTEDYAVLASFN